MTTLPDFDLYETLGVAKDATLAEIKSSHRKLVLKCHPDKIKDESLRDEAQDQFQKVQQAYEVLSDETSRTKYDNKVKLAELKREMKARGGSYSRPTQREFRDGRFYEERVPADARSSNEAFFEDDHHRFTESPRPTSRKHDDYEYGSRTRSRPTPTEEKRKSKTAPSATRAAKEARESTKASRATQDKYRSKERRRQKYEKSYPDSDSESDESEVYYVAVKRPSGTKGYRESKSKPTESSRRSRRHDDDSDDYSDARDYKHDKHDKHDRQYSNARDYIRRSKETILPESERHRRTTHSPARYDSPEPEARPSARSRRSPRETRPPTSHHSSFEHLDPPLKVPSMPTGQTAQTFPGPKSAPSPRPSHQTTRSATATNVRSSSRSTRESVRRSETTVPLMHSDSQTRTTKLRGQKSDSGYVSSSPTGEVPTFTEASPKPRYKTREPIIVEPSSQPAPSRSSRASSPVRPERRQSSRLYGEVEADSHLREKVRGYARPVPRDPPRDVHYIRPAYSGHPQTYHGDYRDDYRDDYAPRPVPRRASAMPA
ncbi:hypothetical protein BJY04DRAFT_87150 [Aspergillus karnatakaensis]|uniref:J domain-containing protein n=1 Tax=Aspergillus karnatakaensis TaxID=1810916 RepID=UPI003CCDEA4F